MILNRLKQYIDYRGISVAAFEKSIGMANASYRNSLKNNGTIGCDKLERILSVYPDINLEWLIRGKGSMLHSPEIMASGVETNQEREDVVKLLLQELGQKNEEIGRLKEQIYIMNKKEGQP